MERFVAQWKVKRIISFKSKVSLTHRTNLIFINQKSQPLMIFSSSLPFQAPAENW